MTGISDSRTSESGDTDASGRVDMMGRKGDAGALGGVGGEGGEEAKNRWMEEQSRGRREKGEGRK